MKYQRYLLLAGLWISCAGCLTGFKQAQAHRLPVQGVTPSTSLEGKNKILADKSNALGENTDHAPLDLSPPDASLQFTEPTPGKLQAPAPAPAQNAERDWFVKPTPKQPSPLQLKGGWVMSQEPETEKRKSVDGAGISINLRP